MRLDDLNYIGRFQVGQEVPLLVHCRDRDRTPSWPDDQPLAQIIDGSGQVIGEYELPVIDRYRVTGLFGKGVLLGQEYALGSYTVKYAYTVSGYQGLLLSTFEVVDGGDIGGPVISLTSVDRPEARYVVAQLGTGRLVQGRNPYV